MKIGLCRLLLGAYLDSAYPYIADWRVVANFNCPRRQFVGFLYRLHHCLELVLDELQERCLDESEKQIGEEDWEESWEEALDAAE